MHWNTAVTMRISNGKRRVADPGRGSAFPFAAASLLLLLLGVHQHALAIHKCTGPDGRITFQDQPCVGVGESFTAKPASGHTRAPSTHSALPDKTPKIEEASKPSPTQAAPISRRPQLDIDADACLAWYLPKLRDPNGAYYKNPRLDKRVLTITLYATNGYGGYVSKEAACEILDGRLDDSWTKTHARRGGWTQ